MQRPAGPVVAREFEFAMQPCCLEKSLYRVNLTAALRDPGANYRL